jgi:hypothetical protein
MQIKIKIIFISENITHCPSRTEASEAGLEIDVEQHFVDHGAFIFIAIQMMSYSKEVDNQFRKRN